MLTDPSDLTRFDHQIIRALYEDAQLPIGDIDEKCDATARIVKRLLDRLMEGGAFDFIIDWRPENAFSGSSRYSFFHLATSAG